VTLARHASAQSYGPSLRTVGFVEYSGQPPGGYRRGDVAVIQGFDGHPHGHMQMYDGSSWISDFSQPDFWPGSSYRSVQPSFSIYRYPGAASTLPGPAGQRARYPGTPLRQGSLGVNVRAVQQQLQNCGSNLTVDGNFGQRTRDAVIAFQRSRNLPADGIVGPRTWAALFGS
jgi:Putative peptidoglycan binding domain